MIMFFPYLLAAVSMVVTAPLIIWGSRKFQLLDRPNDRKIHIHYISRLGGIAFFFSIWLSVWTMHAAGKIFWNSAFWRVIFLGSVAAFAMGLWDDLKNISPKKKLLFQTMLGLMTYQLGFRITEMQIGIGGPIHFGHFSVFVTVLWIVTVMNAFNMIDGLDGLAAGFAFPVFSTLAVLGYLNGSGDVMIISMICAGACFGFLFFNFHPARIFMGDSGSMSLGFMLAILCVSSGTLEVSTNLFMPVFFLAFPLIDLLTAVLRRMIYAKANEKNISFLGVIKRTFNADGNHIHHRLLKLGFSQRKIASIIYAFTVISCCLGLVSVYFSFGLIFFLFIFYVWFTVQCVQLLDYEEFVTGSYTNQKKEFEEKKKLSTAPKLIKKVL